MSWKNTVYYSQKRSQIPTMRAKYSLLGLKSGSTTKELNFMRLPFLYNHIQPRGLMETHSNSDDKDFLKNCFFNQCFDKGRLKNFVLWFLKNYGQNKTVKLVEQLKNIGFEYASKAGISLGIDDLKIPYTKYDLIFDAEKTTTNTIHQYVRGEITGVERFQRLIDTWHRTSESLKQEVIDYFEATDILNPVYMMAFSGARGNISQVRQLVGMRGLMADPQGQIIDFPIRSNFREGLTLTEYLISSYGARKGIVDTALRTANAGYLTRRLVDVAQHVIISHFDCGTHRGIFLKDMKEGNKTIHSLIQRVVGRILARDLIDTSLISKDNMDSPTTNAQNLPFNHLALTQNNLPLSAQRKLPHVSADDLRKYPILAKRNDEITMDLALSIVKKFDKIFVRSPLTCETNQLICQLCYGWSLGQGSTLVSIGEAVGVVAAQSIGEPGTQLTMRTFHTGGVFSGDITDQIRAPFYALVEYPTAIPGTLIRTPEGKIAFLTKGEGSFSVTKIEDSPGFHLFNANINSSTTRKFKIPSYTLLYIRNKQSVNEKEVIAQISTISRKSNATDAAQLTIQSEYEGQFFSKSLSFREKFVGDAKLIESSLTQIRNQKNQSSDSKKEENSPYVRSFNQPRVSGDVSDPIFLPLRTSKKMQSLTTEIESLDHYNRQPSDSQKKEDISSFNEPFNIHHIDKLYEAWNWGYAWVLSGKIYELNLRGETCFPKLGDLVNSRSSMNQTQWNFNFNNGPAKVYYPSKQAQFGASAKPYLSLGKFVKDWTEGRTALNSLSKPSKLFNPISSANSSTQDGSVRRGNSINMPNGQNQHSASTSAQKFINQQPLVSSASNVTLAQPFFSLNILKIRFQKYGYILTSRNKNSSFENHVFGQDFLRNDLLFRMYDINPRISNTLVKKTNLRTLQKNSIGNGNRTLLHWFPNQSQTSTGGFVIFEKLFHNESYSLMKIAQPINFGSRTSPNGSVLNTSGKTVFDISKPFLNNKETESYSYKQGHSKSKNLEFFGTTFNRKQDNASNRDSLVIKKDSALPQLRSSCIQSPLQNYTKLQYFPSIAGSMDLKFTNPKFSPVVFIKGRGFETPAFDNLTNQRGYTASLSLKRLGQRTQTSNIKYANDNSSTDRGLSSETRGINRNSVFSTLKDRPRKKAFFSPFRLQTSSEMSQSGRTFEPGPQSSLNPSIKKQYVSPSFKADFIKQLNTELNYEKTQFIFINESSKDKQTSFKGDTLKAFKPEQNTLKSVSPEIYRSRPFGMRWKNAYQIGLKSRLDNFYNFNQNKEKATSLDLAIMNPYLNASPIYKGKIQNKNLDSLFKKRILWIPNQFFQLINTVDVKEQVREKTKIQQNISANNTVNFRPKEADLFFSKAPLFLQTNRQGHLKTFTSFISFPSLLKTFNDYKSKKSELEFDFNRINSSNKSLSYSPFTQYKDSFINQSFALNQKWSYCGKKLNLSIWQKLPNSSSLTNQKEIFDNKNIFIESSFSQDNHLNPINANTKYSSSSANFPRKKKVSSFFYHNNNYRVNELVSHFVTFCTLTTFNEKKLKETWLIRLKKELSFLASRPPSDSINQILQTPKSYKFDFQISNSLEERNRNSQKLTPKENEFCRTNDLYSSRNQVGLDEGKECYAHKVVTPKVNLSKSYTPMGILSNSIKRQLKKLNDFSHLDQLSLYLLSLNFKPSFINSSCYAPVHQTQTEQSQNPITSFSADTKYVNELHSPSTNSSRFNAASSQNSKDKSLIIRKSYMTHLNLKKGWIFLANNPLKMLAHHKTILYPGQLNDFQLNSSRPLYLECHSITEVFDFQKHCFSAGFHSSDLFRNPYVYRNNLVNDNITYSELENNVLPSRSTSETSYVNFKNKKCIKNLNSRFCLSTDLLSCQFKQQKTDFTSTHFVLNLDDFKSSYNELVSSSNNNSLSTPVNQKTLLNKEPYFSFENKNEYALGNNSSIINSNSVKDSFLYNQNLAFMQQKRKILLSFLSQLQLFKNKSLSRSNDNNSCNNNIVLLIQPIEEYTQMNSKELKTYVSESTVKEDPVYRIYNGVSVKNSSSRQKPTQSILFNPYLGSLLKKRLFQMQQFNKQKLGSQSLSKFPTSDINIHPMSIHKNFAIETSLGNAKIQNPYYRGLNIQKRPMNLAPFFISYSRPMGFDSIFKDQDVSLAYQPLSHFDSVVFPQLSSYVSSFLNVYLTTNRKQKLKYVHSISRANTFPTSLFDSDFKTSSLNLQNGNTNHMERITHGFNADFISRLVESPCFCFQNIFQFKNPLLTFGNLQKDFFGTSKLYTNPFKPKRKKKPSSNPKRKILKNQTSGTLNGLNSNMSSTLFSYSQKNEMFLGVQPLAKTNVFSPFNGEVVLLNVTKGCMVLTTSNLTSYYLAPKSFHFNTSIKNYSEFSNSKTTSQQTENNKGKSPLDQKRVVHQDKLSTSYPIHNILVRFLNMTDIKLDFELACKIHGGSITEFNKNELQLDNSSISSQSDNLTMDSQNHAVISNIKSKLLKVSNLVGGKPNDLNIKVRLGDFCVYGDPITNTTAIQTSGQLVHFNTQKMTLRRSQPIFISPKGILHKFDNDFIDPKTPVITLSYQKLKTGDIIQGIPKVEQFFEARTTKRGRFFRDSLPYLLKSLFKRYSTKLPLDLAVRQSFYKIQQILVDGVHRVYKAQGVTISDKHLEVIVKQMTSKVRIIDGAQTGFFQGEVIDLFFVEKINSFLMKKMTYEPLVLGITKASLEVDSFLSAASFQQTTRVLSKAALFRKKDFLKGLKENVILGNLIPAGTGFLVYIDL